MSYFNEIKRSMEWLAEDPRVLFMGQAVEYPGTAMSNTLVDVPRNQLLELPVAEEMQMGMTVGYALSGKIPVSIFPRWNFLLLAINQLVNHLDKIPQMSRGEFHTKAIIRTAIGSERPLHPHVQHVGDFSDFVQSICTNIEVIRCEEPSDIFPAYQRAFHRDDSKSTIVVEYGDFYGEK